MHAVSKMTFFVRDSDAFIDNVLGGPAIKTTDMSRNEERKDQAEEEEEEDDDEEAEIMEIRGVVMKPGIKWSVAWERHVVDIYTGFEMYQNLKIPFGKTSREITRMLEESIEKDKRMTIDYRIADKEILEVRYR